jgi:hypothetical protein
MADETIIALRDAAAAYASAVRETQRYFDRLEDNDDPGIQAEYAFLAEQEKVAFEVRRDAIVAAGFEAPSIDESDPDH